MAKKQDLSKEAEAYRAIAIEIKELEKKAAPLKKKLTDYAKSINLTDAFDIGGVSIEPRVSEKLSINSELVTPDWLYRAQKAGIKLNVSVKEPVEGADELLGEVEYEEKQSVSYAIRVQA